MRLSKAERLWRGTLTLTAAALLSRGLGMVYRLLLARYLGAEGIGFYQMVFPLYLTLVTIVAGGTPVAVSQLVAEGRVDANRLGRAALQLGAMVAVPLTVALMVLSRPVAGLLYHDVQLAPLLVLIAPAVVAVALSAPLRGVYFGRQRMRTPAAAQVAEQVTRLGLLVVLILGAGWAAMPHGPEAAMILIPLGEVASLALMLWGFRRFGPAPARDGTVLPSRDLIRSILRLGTPVTLGRLLSSALALVEAAMIPRLLVAGGMGRAAAISFFGQLAGMVMPLVFFPAALSFSLATNLVPSIASLSHEPDRQAHQLRRALSITALWCCPVTALLWLLGPRFNNGLFATHMDPGLFHPLVIGAFAMNFNIVLGGGLRGLGRMALPLYHDLVAAGLELIAMLSLGGLPGIGPHALVWAIAGGIWAATLLNARAALRYFRHGAGILAGVGAPTLAAIPAVLLWPALVSRLTPSVGDVPALLLALGVLGLLYWLALGWLGPTVRVRR
jgi:stage V sporulation protein B